MKTERLVCLFWFVCGDISRLRYSDLDFAVTAIASQRILVAATTRDTCKMVPWTAQVSLDSPGVVGVSDGP